MASKKEITIKNLRDNLNVLDKTVGPYRIFQWDRPCVYYTVCWTLGDARLFVECEVKNAYKSISMGEEIEITTEEKPFQERYVCGNGVSWKIELQDNGLVPPGWKPPAKR